MFPYWDFIIFVSRAYFVLVKRYTENVRYSSLILMFVQYASSICRLIRLYGSKSQFASIWKRKQLFQPKACIRSIMNCRFVCTTAIGRTEIRNNSSVNVNELVYVEFSLLFFFFKVRWSIDGDSLEKLSTVLIIILQCLESGQNIIDLKVFFYFPTLFGLR